MAQQLSALGMQNPSELILLTEEELQCILGGLKPVPRRAFVSHCAWDLLCNGTKHADPAAMTSLLRDELGLSAPTELALLSTVEWQRVLQQFKPVPRTLFMKYMRHLSVSGE